MPPARNVEIGSCLLGKFCVGLVAPRGATSKWRLRRRCERVAHQPGAGAYPMQETEQAFVCQPKR
jgi:hypothetical protein